MKPEQPIDTKTALTFRIPGRGTVSVTSHSELLNSGIAISPDAIPHDWEPATGIELHDQGINADVSSGDIHSEDEGIGTTREEFSQSLKREERRKGREFGVWGTDPRVITTHATVIAEYPALYKDSGVVPPGAVKGIHEHGTVNTTQPRSTSETKLFVSIEEAQKAHVASTAARIQYGSKDVVFATVEAKPARKMHTLLSNMKDAGMFAPGVEITSDALLHSSTGDPAFVKIETPNHEWFVSGKVISVDGSKIERGKLPKSFAGQRTAILSGVCLFGEPSAQGITTDGSIISLTNPGEMDEQHAPIETLYIDPFPHAYEIDTTLRLNTFINEALPQPDVPVIIHIPQVEYYLYGVSRYQKGQFTREQLEQWFDTVDIRSQRMYRMMEKRAQNAIQIATPLYPIKEYIRTSDEMDMKKMIELLKDADPVWEKLIARKEASEDWALQEAWDINNLSYAYAYMQTAKDHDLVIAAENPEESRILVHAQKEMGVLDTQATIAAFYVHPRVLTQHPHARQLLFFHPNHDGRRIDSLQEIIRANRANRVSAL